MDESNTEVVATMADTSGGEASNATEATPPVDSPSAEDMAAHDYRMLIPRLYSIIDFLPKKQLLRVVKALIEYPLENNQPVFSFESEKKAFTTGMQIFDCKFVLMKALMEIIKDKEAMKQLKEDIEKAKVKKNDL